MSTMNTVDIKARQRLIDEIQIIGNEILLRGKNPKFVLRCEPKKKHVNMRDLCEELIKEAKKCAAKGVNCKFICNAERLRIANNSQNFRDRQLLKGDINELQDNA